MADQKSTNDSPKEQGSTLFDDLLSDCMVEISKNIEDAFLSSQNSNKTLSRSQQPQATTSSTLGDTRSKRFVIFFSLIPYNTCFIFIIISFFSFLDTNVVQRNLSLEMNEDNDLFRDVDA